MFRGIADGDIRSALRTISSAFARRPARSMTQFQPLALLPILAHIVPDT